MYKVIAVANPAEGIQFEELENLFGEKAEEFGTNWSFNTITGQNGKEYIVVRTTENRGFIRNSRIIGFVGVTKHGSNIGTNVENLNSELGGSIIADISEIDGKPVIRLLAEAEQQ